MEDLLTKLLALAPSNLTQTMSADVEFSVKSLLISAESAARADSNEVANALFKIQAVLDVTWEQLNTGHWSNVPLHLRHVYTAASFVKVLLLLKQASKASRRDTLSAALKAADMGLLLGAPLPPTSGACLTKAAAAISATLTALDQSADSKDFGVGDYDSDEQELKQRMRGEPILRLQRPSIERFRREHFQRQVPAVLTDCMGHWPAMERWRSPRYLRQVAGGRTVPVELGSRYTDVEWRQRLMSLGEFIDKHVLGKDPETGYLAQHPLFQQVPELRADIRQPDYCCVTSNDDDVDDVDDDDVEVNAWFGPKGTVSPLHFDPKHNLLAQVVGRKRVYLFPPSDSALLRPHPSPMLANTAQTDPERPDSQLCSATVSECVLAAGEMLYIPASWWHHVRSLDTSFSVSFWWR